MVKDGLGTGIQASRQEVGSELEDDVDYGLVDLVRTARWAVSPGFQTSRSFTSVSSQQFVEPTARDRVLANQSIRALFT